MPLREFTSADTSEIWRLLNELRDHANTIETALAYTGKEQPTYGGTPPAGTLPKIYRGKLTGTVESDNGGCVFNIPTPFPNGIVTANATPEEGADQVRSYGPGISLTQLYYVCFSGTTPCKTGTRVTITATVFGW